MSKGDLVKFLCRLNSSEEEGVNSENLWEEKFIEICSSLDTNYEKITTDISTISNQNFSENITVDWKCICLSFYIIKLLNSELEKSDDVLLSVQQTKEVRKCLRNIVDVGICARLQPKLPFFKKSEESQSDDIFWNYNVLKCTTFGLCEFLKSPHLRLLFIPECLKEVLVAVFQIAFCPLKKPSGDAMTEEMYTKLLKEQELSAKLLNRLKESIHPSIFVKETMIIFRENSPVWFKKAVSRTLTTIIRSKNGVEIIAMALLGDFENDSTQTWKILEVISRLILSCRNFPDFEKNICKQVVALLDKISEDSSVFERIFTHCTKALYQVDQESTKNNFVRVIISHFIYFTYRDHKFENGEDVTLKLKQCSRLLNAVFLQNTYESPSLPLKILQPVINVIFRFYSLTLNSPLISTNNDLKAVLLGYIRRYPEDSSKLFDSFLFGISTEDVLPFRTDICLQLQDEKVILKASPHSVIFSSSEAASGLLELIKSDSELMQKLFGFLLNCLTDKDKYFKKANPELLELEHEIMNQFLERKITVYKLLADLAEDEVIQKEVTKNPYDVVKYIGEMLEKTLQLGLHKNADSDSDEFQSLFTVLMILQSLASSCNIDNMINFRSLLGPLREISRETENHEAKDLIEQILSSLKGGKVGTIQPTEEKSNFDGAIEDICDPLLPVRGHGLMSLTKLVEGKDEDAMKRKNYVLNIFQQNLKNDDSFIYLNAINGLAALADVFPDSVLTILCDEYSNSSRKNTEDGHEVRMKLGESLVRVTKKLGDMAPKYKSLLLNTFLVGAKEEDDLIRASSLSNLGEICRVLGYKLGTIVTEVLVCVHAIIATDKSPQARRAAVTVLRQLFVGLDKEMIAYLKDDILTIYRTLKDIYNNDHDDVMRLQAQLALEELNENMKNFVFPNPELHFEKRIVMLD